MGEFLEYMHWKQNNTGKHPKTTRKTPVPEKDKQKRVYTSKAQPVNKGHRGKIRICATWEIRKENTPKGPERPGQLPNGENK